MTQLQVLWVLVSAAALLLAAAATTPAGAEAEGPLVNTLHGTVRGLTTDKGSHVFLGIPFAQPPLGHLRWHPPQPHSWTGVLNTTRWGNQCHNTLTGNSFVEAHGPLSEDCLYLNVWVPKAVHDKAGSKGGAAAANVVVFLHGGGFILGSASNPFVSPDPENLAIASGSVVVSFNYRLGVLGFLSHRALPSTSGLSGILDQVAALEWVKRNIHLFGGNPNSVTLVGESAGAISICMLATMPSTEGLFHRVILESPMCDFPFHSMKESYMQGEDLVKSVNCHRFDTDREVAECLAGKTSDDLIAGLRVRRGIMFYDGVLWFPVIDGHMIPRPPIQSMLAGQMHKNLKVMLGYNLDEGSMFVMLGFPVYVDFDQAIDILESAVGSTRAYRLEQTYHPHGFGVRDMFNRMMSDLWACSVHRTALALSKWIPKGVFVYHFRHTPSHASWPFSSLGAYHGAEMAYAFQHLTNGNFTPDELALSARMQQDWSSFIATGRPKSAGWAPYSSGVGRGQLEYSLNMTEDMTSWPMGVCSFWDSTTVDDLVVMPRTTLAEPMVSRLLNEAIFKQLKQLGDLRMWTALTAIALIAYGLSFRRGAATKSSPVTATAIKTHAGSSAASVHSLPVVEPLPRAETPPPPFSASDSPVSISSSSASAASRPATTTTATTASVSTKGVDALATAKTPVRQAVEVATPILIGMLVLVEAGRLAHLLLPRLK